MNNYKYEYYLKLWGGMFNKNDHNIRRGDLYFDTEKERDNYLKKAQEIEKSLDRCDARLAYTKAEGFTVRTFPELHRICEYKGQLYHSSYKWSSPCPDINTLMYHMEYKWYPGFNDTKIEEEVSEEVNYSQVTVIQEWITGAFTHAKLK